MKNANILAHRGWWDTADQKNTPFALQRALEAGYGIETDFRDLNGALVVSHDPPAGQDILGAETFFGLYSDLSAKGRLALNIKADGLQQMLLDALQGAGVDLQSVYAFDMAVPDALGYLPTPIPAYTRISEYEAVPSFLDRAAGVWVDNFTGDFPQVAEAARLMGQGHRVAIVSPELHRRDHRALWDDIAAAGLHENPLFELCTDLPHMAADFLGTDS
ncbi:PI-PLC domain-containing protein [Tropicibacter oceani]|uniref:Glycerophosphodiester phosphodiesterase n=1 Tax=Tropicibacter oceani TaxID=3058420 RepID=A0ABY8QNA6_9RHOB|nr:hypothetical protein [Tropicibacter oceani]WGW06069.1 hypothetical protein QF118_19680 [Tropicibacter oceani]